MKYPIDGELFPYSRFRPPLNRFTLPAANLVLRLLPKGNGKKSGLTFKKLNIYGQNGKNNALLIGPADGVLPCLLYFHGGGFILQAAPYHYALARIYALRAPCKVLFVNYSLAPAHKYPAALNDCAAALDYAFSNADGLGIDKNRIAAGGDSAGAWLAATLARRTRGTGRLCGQMLIYPVIEDNPRTPSMQKYIDSPMWNAQLNGRMWKYFLGGQRLPQYTDLSLLPPAYVETAEHDCLRDEGTGYANALASAGNSVVLRQTEGTMHGYDIKIKSSSAKKSIEERIAFLRGIFYGGDVRG